MSDIRGSKRFREWFEANQEQKIVRLVVFRKPLLSQIEKIANIISFGKYEEAKKQFNYDKMFHLYLFMTFENGNSYILEKNEVLNVEKVNSPREGSNGVPVDIPSDLTLQRLIHPAFQIMGNNFATYDHRNNNCQIFVNTILRGSQLLTNTLQDFIMQNAEQIARAIPEVGNKLAKYAIDMARSIDTILHGSGLIRKPHF